MGVLGAFFGCRGDGGFNGRCLGASSGVVGFNVAMLLRLMREKVRPAWPDVCVSAKKFALRAHNGSKLAFLRLLGELFAEMLLKGPCWASFSRQSDLRPGLVGDVAHEAGCGGGFAALEAGWLRVAGVSYL